MLDQVLEQLFPCEKILFYLQQVQQINGVWKGVDAIIRDTVN